MSEKIVVSHLCYYIYRCICSHILSKPTEAHKASAPIGDGTYDLHLGELKDVIELQTTW